MQRLSSGASLDHGLRTDHRGLAWEQALHQERVPLGVAVSTAIFYDHQAIIGIRRIAYRRQHAPARRVPHRTRVSMSCARSRLSRSGPKHAVTRCLTTTGSWGSGCTSWPGPSVLVRPWSPAEQTPRLVSRLSAPHCACHDGSPDGSQTHRAHVATGGSLRVEGGAHVLGNPVTGHDGCPCHTRGRSQRGTYIGHGRKHERTRLSSPPVPRTSAQ